MMKQLVASMARISEHAVTNLKFSVGQKKCTKIYKSKQFAVEFVLNDLKRFTARFEGFQHVDFSASTTNGLRKFNFRFARACEQND